MIRIKHQIWTFFKNNIFFWNWLKRINTTTLPWATFHILYTNETSSFYVHNYWIACKKESFDTSVFHKGQLWKQDHSIFKCYPHHIVLVFCIFWLLFWYFNHILLFIIIATYIVISFYTQRIKNSCLLTTKQITPFHHCFSYILLLHNPY